MRKFLISVLILISISSFFGGQVVLGLSNKSDNDKAPKEEVTILPEKELQRFATVIYDVKKYYYKDMKADKLFTRAISGMLSNLDPHSAYLDSRDLKDLQMETIGEFGGIGVEVIPDQGAIRVVTPLDDTPAYKSGIKAGDYIIQINDKLVRDMTLRDAIGMMRGKKGSNLSLTILRKDEPKPLVIKLKRQTISIKTVKSRMLESGYGYIRLALFQEPTEKDMVNAIKKLQKNSNGGLKGLILDMRNNPGGLFEAAVQVADNFLDSKKMEKNNRLIVYTKGQGEEAQITVNATPGDILPNIPIVVLVNEGSASAAEIVAGALQDHKRAVVVGARSFGKGSVQTLIPIDKSSAIKLTTALYYTPSGKSIQAMGIEPDIMVAELKLSKDGLSDYDIPRIDEAALLDHIANGNKKDNKSSREIIKKRKQAELNLAYKDFQLYEALHVLKAQSVMR